MEDRYRAQHAERLAWMPWLWDRRTEAQRVWADPWQRELQARLMEVERVRFGEDVFLAPSAHLFAEPNRDIVVGDRVRIGAEVFVHGPVVFGPDVSLNPRCHLDGGRAGIRIGAGCRIAEGVRMFAFDHGMELDRPIREQPVRSRGIELGADVWVGAGAGITDGVRVGDGAVIAMGAVVTREVPAGAVVAGVPARVVRARRDG